MQKLNVIGYSFTNEGDGEKKYYKAEDCYTTVASHERCCDRVRRTG